VGLATILSDTTYAHPQPDDDHAHGDEDDDGFTVLARRTSLLLLTPSYSPLLPTLPYSAYFSVLNLPILTSLLTLPRITRSIRRGPPCWGIRSDIRSGGLLQAFRFLDFQLLFWNSAFLGFRISGFSVTFGIFRILRQNEPRARRTPQHACYFPRS
jgi:hypothetical protein